MSSSLPHPPQSTVLEEIPLFSGDWIRAHKKVYSFTDSPEKLLDWECIDRTTTTGTMTLSDGSTMAIDGADILALTTLGEIILILNYRPPVGKSCVEMMGGLIDKNESLREAAARELQEESGYVGDIIGHSPYPLYSSPWLTNEPSVMFGAIVDVSPDGPNKNGSQQKLDDHENITVIRVPLLQLLCTLNRLQNNGFAIELRLYMLALGIDMGQHLVDVNSNVYDTFLHNYKNMFLNK